MQNIRVLHVHSMCVAALFAQLHASHHISHSGSCPCSLSCMASSRPCPTQVLHVGFSLWAFSLFGVSQSPLVTGLFASIVQAACTTTEAGWLAVSGISATELSRRLLSQNAVHLLIVLLLMVGALTVKLTLTRWIQVSLPGLWPGSCEAVAECTRKLLELPAINPCLHC